MKYIFQHTVSSMTITILFLSILFANVYADTFELLNNDLKEYYKDLPVLVTGGCGFIGSHLVETLVNLQAQVTILDNLSSGSM